MRELKFRAWVYYGERLKKPNYSRDYGSLDRFFEDHDENDIDQCIEQYTGLKDKNGKEIYEGDIVQLYKHCSPEKDGKPMAVKWNEKKCGYDGIYPTIAVWDMHEIIGNIHENPELLEEK